MTSQRTEVVVVDDDAELAKALSRLIATAGYSVRTFGSAREFFESWRQSGPTCVILDMHLPGLDGLEVHRRLLETGNVGVATIFLTGYGTVSASVEAIKSGAFDFLEKPVPADKLLHTIDAALAEVEKGHAASRRLADLERRYESLTQREREVMNLVVAGLLNKQIAGRLGISVKTVKVHRGRVMSKIGAKRLPHLMKAASTLGLIKGLDDSVTFVGGSAPARSRRVVEDGDRASARMRDQDRDRPDVPPTIPIEQPPVQSDS